MAGWITREYFFFDYTCLLLHQNRSNSVHSTTFGPRLIYGAAPESQPKKRNLRFLEFNSTIPQFVGDIDSAKSGEPYAYIYDTKGHLIDDESAFVFDEPIILDADYQQQQQQQQNQFGDNNHLRRSKRSVKETADPPNPTPTPTPKPKPKKYVIRRRKKQPIPLTTMQSIVSIEQLPLSNEQGEQGKLIKIKTTKIKSFPSNSTLLKRRRKKKPKSKLSASSAEHLHKKDNNNVQQHQHQQPQDNNGQQNHYYPNQEDEEDGDKRRLKKLAHDEIDGEVQGRTLRAYKGAAKSAAARRGGAGKAKPKGMFLF
uniref:Uncharacterized protein n=1 Tax=Panagrolaimus superbus TaxID=310955 RepID=A0A914Y9C3_9BILA